MPEPWTSSASVPIAGSGASGGIVTLVEESAFCISDASGDMEPGLPHGLIFRDTRYLSEMRLLLNGAPPQPLSAQRLEPFRAAFVGQAAPRDGQADSHLLLTRRRYVGQGMREDIVARNFGTEPAFCAVELHLDADFADLFEVKEGRVRPGATAEVTADGPTLVFRQTAGTRRHGVRIALSGEPAIDDRVVSYEVIVPARGQWSACLEVAPILGERVVDPRYRCGQPVERATPQVRLQAWRARLPTFTSGHRSFSALLARSTEDLAALRIFDPDFPDRAVIAAGAPWFMTVFGRDSLITGWMTMPVDSDLALGTLQTLARFQGTKVNPLTEEEPGRILHEMRFGASAELSLGGGRAYYGTIDATPLFVMLLGELARWGNRREDVDALLPAADRALEWIDSYGDVDGDGYVEYQRTSDRGLRNQGWKDSWDGVRFADGRLPETPIALCEVQGYVYAALVARAYFAVEHGDAERAHALVARAEDLKARFNRDFWLEERGCFAMGLDRDKQPIDAVASNMGHCLWTGIVDDEKAPLVASMLMSPEMFTGWGIRTLSSSMTGFNPVSYHCGSVWPHDNALAAAGLMRYGFVEESHRVMEGLVRAASAFGLRLPELFAGLDRAEFDQPVGYPTSCSPQAWAAASPLLFLRTLLRFEPDLRHHRVHLAPVVPEWVGNLTLERVPLLGGRLSVEVSGTSFHVLEQPEGVTVDSVPRSRLI